MEMASTLHPTAECETDMKVGDCSIWHCLIFCEEFVSDNLDVICWECKESILGYSTFKCLECNFMQHQSCTQLSDFMGIDIEHDITNRHHLILREETENNGKKEVVCGGCGEVASGSTYRCSIPECTFHLHTSCHQLPHAIQHDAHLEHTLILSLPPLTFFCDLCGKDRERDITLLYGCRSCNFDLDNKCASTVKLIGANCDQHTFILCQKSIAFPCEACGEETKDVACQCSICGVLTHPKCASFPRIIKIKFHHHFLSRTYYLRRVKKLEEAICKLCCKKVNTKCGAYYCEVCNYIVHMRCAKSLQDKSEGIDLDDYTMHLVYLVEGLNEIEDKTTDAPSKINHYCHPKHEFILIYKDHGSDKRCEACMQFIIFFPFYGCNECNIFLHKRCVELPETISRKPFCLLPSTLYSQPPYTDELFLCAKCSRYRQGFFYEYNRDGKRRNDVQCFLIPETINHEGHRHLLHIPLLID